MFISKKSESTFVPLREDDVESGSEEPMLHKNGQKQEQGGFRDQRFWSSRKPWMFTTMLLSLYIVASSVKLNYQKAPVWRYTEFATVRPFVEEIQKQFTAGLDYNNENHTLQRTPTPGIQYTGRPSREIDAAWENIAGLQEIYITKEEAIASSVEDTYLDPLTELYEVEIEGFHHLHCLNYIRKSIDIKDYPDMQEQDAEGTWRMHVEHCIDSIREFIMCKADMTPIVLVPPERSGVPVPVPEFRTTHVCRNYEKLLNWAKTERNADMEKKEESLELAKRIREKTGTKY